MPQQADLSKYRIAAIQMDTVPRQLETNREHAIELAQVAIERGARLIVYPELCDIDEISGAHALATPAPGPFTDPFQQLAVEHHVHFAVGMARRDGEKCTNSAVFIGPQGILGAYDKVHAWAGSWDERAGDWAEDPRRIEPHNYLPGEEFRVFDIDGVQVGAMICYDGFFAESWLCNRLMGADLVIWPTNRESYPDIDIPAIARFFQLNVAAVNRYGQSTYWTVGDSAIVDSSGRTLAHAIGGESVLIADIDIVAARARRRADLTMRDRRPELYGAILRPAPQVEQAPGRRSCEVTPLWDSSNHRGGNNE